MRLKPVLLLGSSVDPVFMDGQLSLVKRAPGTCSQSITLLLKPGRLLGYWRTKALKPSLPV